MNHRFEDLSLGPWTTAYFVNTLEPLQRGACQALTMLGTKVGEAGCNCNVVMLDSEFKVCGGCAAGYIMWQRENSNRGKAEIRGRLRLTSKGHCSHFCLTRM